MGLQIVWAVEEVGPMIIRCAQGLVEDVELAEWLRDRALAG